MRGETHGLHPLTAQALAEVRAARGKAIVLLNRRGWSNFLSCRSCGRVWSCPDCDVALVLHRAGGYLACHHCGHREPAPARCGDCSSTSVARHGAGTERLQHELASVLDDGRFPVFRLDADVVAAGALLAARARARGRGCSPVLSRRRGARRRRAPAPLRGGRVRGADRHPDGRQGPRLPRRHPRGRARRRRHPALPRLPRRGAHVRADRPARRARRARRPRTRAGADDRARRARDRARRRHDSRRLPRRRARAPPRARLPALLPPDQDRLLGRRVAAGGTRPPRSPRAAGAFARAPHESVVAGIDPARAAIAAGSLPSRPRHPVSPARPRAPGARREGRRAPPAVPAVGRPCGAWPARASTRESASAWTSIRSRGRPTPLGSGAPTRRGSYTGR